MFTFTTPSNLRRTTFSRRSAFTLIELLVVISIIGILIAMAAAAFTAAQRSSRDARRQADMRAIQNAQEQYYAENSSSYRVHIVGTPCNADLSPHLPVFPVDPRNTTGSQYVCDMAADGYCACAPMDTANGNSTDENCGFSSGGGGDWFCVTNLQ